MKKTSSLNHMTEVFFFFLFVIVCANIEDLYEPFLSFAKEGNTPFATMYGLELLAFVCGVAGIGRFVFNARKQRFFTKENYLLFYSMGIALFTPGFDLKSLPHFLFTENLSDKMYEPWDE